MAEDFINAQAHDVPAEAPVERKARAPRKFNPDEAYSMVYDAKGMLQHWQNGRMYSQTTGLRMD